MNILILSKFIVLAALLFNSALAQAGLIAGPGNIVKVDETDIPRWFTAGRGDDGYVTVRASIDMGNDVTCRNLGSNGWLGIGRESIQIVASVKSIGFDSDPGGRTWPLATFDSRINPGACIGLSSMPLTLISMVPLEKFTTGFRVPLFLLFEVNSTSNSNVNLVGAAQIALGAASVFASGGAAATLTGLSATLAKPALEPLETQVNAHLSNIFNGQASYPLSLQDLRKGIRSISVPVYAGRANRGSEERAIRELKASPDPRAKLFDIVLKFSYHRSIFEDLAGSTSVPSGANIAPAWILSYPNWDNKPVGIALLQQINSANPKLQQDVAKSQYPKEWKVVCDRLLDTLRKGGLNQLDRAIVLKAFIDEAKDGSIWYTSSNLNACLDNNMAAVRADVVQVFGPPSDGIVYVDMVEGAGPEFLKWKADVAPVLSRMKRAMMAKEAKAEMLTGVLSDKATVHFDPNSTRWLEGGQAATGGVIRLTMRDIKRAGCFVHAGNVDFDDIAGYGAHMILLGPQDDLWRVQLKLTPGPDRRISTVLIEELDDNWREHFKTQRYSGGECPTILKSL